MMRADSPWRGLPWRLAAATAVAVVLVVGGRLVGLAFSPVPTVVIALVLAAATWFWPRFNEPSSRPPWSRPQPPLRAAQFNADARTRRLATVLSRAQPGAGFESATLARTLTELVEARSLPEVRGTSVEGQLTTPFEALQAAPQGDLGWLSHPKAPPNGRRRGGLDTAARSSGPTRPAVPGAGNPGGGLSPELAAYLQDAHDGRPRPLTRRALHAHLKEIDQL